MAYEVVIQNSRYEVVIEEREVVAVIDGTLGPPGPPGTGVGRPVAEDFDVVDPVLTEYVLDFTPIEDSIALYINGLLQRASAFSVEDSTVSLPEDLSLQAGDILSFRYGTEE